MSMNIGGIATGEYQDSVRRHIASEPSVKSLPIPVFIGASIAADFLIFLVMIFSVQPFSEGRAGFSMADAASAILSAAAYNLTCQRGRLYDIRTLRDGVACFGQILFRWSVLCALLLAAMAVAGTATRTQCAHWLLYSAIGLTCLTSQRAVIGHLIRLGIRQGRFIHTVAFVGDDATADGLIEKIAGPLSGIHVAGVFSEKAILSEMDSAAEPDHSLRGLFGREDIDSVIIATPAVTAGGMGALLPLLRKHPLNIYATPECFSLPKISSAWMRQTGFPELALMPLVNCPNNRAELLIKNVIDRMTALLLVLLASPLMLVCALGIALSDRGPIFFRQKRIGYRGREFSILKFRTMYTGPRPNTRLTTRNDPRVFPFGRLLRGTSLDELPQLLNVLKGDMSLVGPRPHMPEATAAGILYFEAVGEYTARHRVKPGITGWAQVNGYRGPTETIGQIEARVAHDIYYIENWSLVMDFMILYRTMFVMFGKNVF